MCGVVCARNGTCLNSRVSNLKINTKIKTKMRTEPVVIAGQKTVQEILSYYMGKNTPDRQKFIIENLIHDNSERD